MIIDAIGDRALLGKAIARLAFPITRSLDHARSPDLLFPEPLKEPDDRLNPAIKVGDVKFFVGSMQVVVRQAEAHHYAGQLQYVLKFGHNRNRAAGAYEDRVFLEDVMQGRSGGLDVRVVGADNARRPFAVDFNFSLNALGGQLLDVAGIFFQDGVGVLVGHQPHGDLGRSPGRDHRLGA